MSALIPTLLSASMASVTSCVLLRIMPGQCCSVCLLIKPNTEKGLHVNALRIVNYKTQDIHVYSTVEIYYDN